MVPRIGAEKPPQPGTDPPPRPRKSVDRQRRTLRRDDGHRRPSAVRRETHGRPLQGLQTHDPSRNHRGYGTRTSTWEKALYLATSALAASAIIRACVSVRPGI